MIKSQPFATTANKGLKLHKPTMEGQLRIPLIIAHMLLGLLLYSYPELGTIHAYMVIFFGVLLAVTQSDQVTACVGAYIIGSEVLWRMTSADVFWEIGKYSICLILLLAILRRKQTWFPLLPFLYFLPLLASIPLTIDTLGLAEGIEGISFNLSGPFTIFVATLFFSKQRLDSPQLLNILTFIALPAITIAVYNALGTFTAEEIQWVNDSMFATSGGFGPNQMSTFLGLGSFVLWLLLFLEKFNYWQKGFILTLCLFVFVQGLLTFSRGGNVAAVISISLATVYFLRGNERKLEFLLGLIAILALITFVLVPALNDFTQGYFERRFSDANLTGRDSLIAIEWQLFLENPLIGIGPGVGKSLHHNIASHTEYSRSLAEHGLLGLLSSLSLFILLIQRSLIIRKVPSQTLGVLFILWALVTMTNSAIRLSVIPFTFGLGLALINLSDSTMTEPDSHA